MKTIRKPDIPGAVRMTPLQLNSIHFSEKHTRLTPEILEQYSKVKSGQNARSKKQGL